jgi:hypothetical protein
MIQEMLEVEIIQPSQNSLSSPVVMVTKKDGSWHMCPDYKQFNKMTIKYKFPIPFIDELLDELHREKLFTKLDIHSGYHQIRMRQVLSLKFAPHCYGTDLGHFSYCNDLICRSTLVYRSSS